MRGIELLTPSQQCIPCPAQGASDARGPHPYKQRDPACCRSAEQSFSAERDLRTTAQ